MTTPNRWERLLPACGPAFSVLLVLAAAAFPMPSGDDSPAHDAVWLAAHRTPVLIQGYLRAVAAIAFVLLALAVSQTIRRRLGDGSLLARIALAGGALSGALMLLAQATVVGAALASHAHAGTQAVRALGYLQDGVLTLSSLPAIALFAAAGVAFLRERLVPTWLAYLTLAGIPLGLLDAISFSGSPFEAVGLLGLFYFLFWSLATGTTLALRPRPGVRMTEQTAIA